MEFSIKSFKVGLDLPFLAFSELIGLSNELFAITSSTCKINSNDFSQMRHCLEQKIRCYSYCL